MIKLRTLLACLLVSLPAFAAVITPVETIIADSNGKTIVVLWETMGNADTGTAVERTNFMDRSVQITGTFGGATVVIQGSNDGTNFVTLADFNGDAISVTASGLYSIAPAVRYIRPVTSGGSGSDIDVTLFGRSQ